MTPLGQSASAAPAAQGSRLLVSVTIAAAMFLGVTCGQQQSAVVGQIQALEAEHQSLLVPAETEPASRPHWTPPVLDADAVLFSWRLTAQRGASTARNATQVAAVLTLTTPNYPPIVCKPRQVSELSVLCGGATVWAPRSARYVATLDVDIRAGDTTAHTTKQGSFIRGLQRDADGWGGAEWIGLVDPNATAAQFRSQIDIRKLGFTESADVSQATLFVAGLGGHRATINGRPLDPTSVRASVTEWSNRTFYFADDVTVDMATAADGDGRVAIGIELYKHWYGLSNRFYPVPYGPRSLKAVLAVTHRNGSQFLVSPTCSATTTPANDCVWRHASGPTTHEDLHTGQSGDGRLATPHWESADYDATSAPLLWSVPTAVLGPPGELRPHPMQRSRVLEVARPMSVAQVSGDKKSGPGTTYRFSLAHEVAGFCTLIMPHGAKRGMKVTIRHGEAVDMGSGLLVDVECTMSLGPNHGLGCVHMSYIARGDATGMGAHDTSWRQLALTGNASSRGNAIDAQLEAFTPAFQFSAFRFVEVTYDHEGQHEEAASVMSTLQPPDMTSLACYRIGAAFDWSGDVMVAPPESDVSVNALSGEDSRGQKKADNKHTPSATTAAHRFNVVVAATRSTAISNYLMDFPTDCPHREKRGWTGDSLAAHSAVSSFFDMRAAWTKWIDDMLLTQSMLEPAGAMPTIVPCIFPNGACRGDPRHPAGRRPPETFADVAWGSVLPLLGAYTARLTGDKRFASRVAAGASAYVNLLHDHANNASTSTFPGLLNYTNWSGHLGDWCPAVGHSSVSTLLNSHHVILDFDAVVDLLNLASQDEQYGYREQQQSQVTEPPSAQEIQHWAHTARASFVQAFLRNVTAPGTEALPTCGSVPENKVLLLGCPINQSIVKVVFAGYGVPAGSCETGLHSNSTCFADVRSEVSTVCLGKNECSVECKLIPHKRICAGVNISDPCSGVPKSLSVSVECSPGDKIASIEPGTETRSDADNPIVGPSFLDPYPPTPGAGPQPQTEAASGLAAMEMAPPSLINDETRIELGNMLVALVKNHNHSLGSLGKKVSITGGIIDMAHLVPQLIKHGHPDVGFDVLAAEGTDTYYNMAKFGGTLWENWDNANGCDTHSGCDNKDVQSSGTGVGSLNHIMYGGSVGSAVFLLGGIQPFSSTHQGPRVVSPIPWLLDAPRGSAVWRSQEGILSATWSASSDSISMPAGDDAASWSVWINVSIPIAALDFGSIADVRVMLPEATDASTVCAWECGLTPAGSPTPSSGYTSDWISFDAGGGHEELKATVPPQSSTAARPIGCATIWKAGEPVGNVAGVVSIDWVASRPGYSKFPALSVIVSSGDFALFASNNC